MLLLSLKKPRCSQVSNCGTETGKMSPLFQVHLFLWKSEPQEFSLIPCAPRMKLCKEPGSHREA